MKSLSKNQSNFIKLIAAVSMLLDHTGAFLLPQPKFSFLKAIGRISFPLFAFQLRVGFQNTSNFKNYLKKMVMAGLFAQIPYGILFNNLFRPNILFILAIGLLIFYTLEKKKYLLTLFLSIVLFLPFFNAIYSTFIFLGFYFFKGLIFQFLTLLLYAFTLFLLDKNWIHFFSPLATLFFNVKPNFKISVPKHFFYYFYPLHLWAILFIKLVMGKI